MTPTSNPLYFSRFSSKTEQPDSVQPICGLNRDANCMIYGAGVLISGLLFLITLIAIIKLRIDTKP
jgi:hypothetical protein